MIDSAVPYRVSKFAVINNAAFTVVHTVAPLRWLSVRLIHVVNVSGGPVTVNFCAVPPGGTPTAANALLWTYKLDADQYLRFSDDDIFPPGYSLQCQASAANSINVKLAGIEEYVLGFS